LFAKTGFPKKSYASIEITMREIALDTETTGLDPKSGHRMVEIGCVELWGHVRTGKHFHVYLNPERDVPPDAERIHGLSTSFLADKPTFVSIAKEFIAFLADSPLIIHNASFDMGFLNYQLAAAGHPILPMNRAIDTVKIARAKFPGSPANLDALCRRFNIDLAARKFHGALLDAELLADVYLELKGGRQAQMSLEAEKEPQSSATQQSMVMRPARSFPPTAAEEAAHHAFLTKIKDPIWLREKVGS
jgi:DNA polymerase-3 subunit epsilon